MVIAVGFPIGPLLLSAGFLALIFSYRYIYSTFYLGSALALFGGITLSVSTGSLLLGERAFGGSVDVGVGEAVLFFVLAAWAVKLIRLWRKRRDHNWQPRLPLLVSYGALVVAHVVSAASRLLPDPVLVFKYSLRPVALAYLAYIALPVNLIRSRRRLVAVLGVIASVGIFGAVTGIIAMFFPTGGGLIGRAHPLGIFGIHPLGENHNQLADLLVFTVPFTLALARLIKDRVSARLLMGFAALQFLAGLLTFTRTIWLIFGVELILFAATVWRPIVRAHLSRILLVLALLLPLGVAMTLYTVSDTAKSSNSTRTMLAEIGFDMFRSSPWIGGGAGTFVDRVGATRVFVLEYGDPLDAHGFIQKLGAETGILGLLALCFLVVQVAVLIRRAFRELVPGSLWYDVSILLGSGAGGAFAYQLLNTEYWSSKMWLPLGILLAGLSVARSIKEEEVVS